MASTHCTRQKSSSCASHSIVYVAKMLLLPETGTPQINSSILDLYWSLTVKLSEQKEASHV